MHIPMLIAIITFLRLMTSASSLSFDGLIIRLTDQHVNRFLQVFRFLISDRFWAVSVFRSILYRIMPHTLRKKLFENAKKGVDKADFQAYNPVIH